MRTSREMGMENVAAGDQVDLVKLSGWGDFAILQIGRGRDIDASVLMTFSWGGTLS